VGETVSSTRARISAFLLIVAGSLFLTACPPREKISKIQLDPGRYAGKEIGIAGRVVDSFGAMGRGVFQIDDGTGRMWVLSTRYGVPGTGAKVAVIGRIEQGFSFGGRNFGTVLKETERRQ